MPLQEAEGPKPSGRASGRFLALAIVAGTLAGLDLFSRLFPALLPRPMQVLSAQRALDKEVYRHDPVLGHCLKPSLRRDIRWGGFSLGLSHQPLPGGKCGYRAGPEDEGGGLREASYADIVVLGDSHAYGMEVDAKAVWPSLLAEGSGSKVANLGVRMYGTTQSASLYLAQGRKLSPGLVLLLLCPNDPWDNEVFAAWRAGEGIPEPLSSDEMMYRVCGTLGLASAPGTCRAVVGFGRTGLLAHLLLSRSMAWLHHWKGPLGGDAGMRSLQEDIRRLAAGAGPARLAVILNEGWPEERRRGLAAFLAGTGLPWTELSGMRGGGRSLALDGHWSEAGHREAAPDPGLPGERGPPARGAGEKASRPRRLFQRAFLAACMALFGTMAGLAGTELFLRASCSGRAADIRRSYFAMTSVWVESGEDLAGSRPGEDPSLRPKALRPGVRLSQTVCGRRHAFTSLPAPAPGVAFRSNGEAGEEEREVHGLVLGDSFAEGAQVDDAETFSAVLSRLSGKRFVNLGVRAQGTTGHLERLEKSGFLRLRPRVLIVQVHENDLLEDAWLELGRRGARRAQPTYFRRSGRAFYDRVAERMGLKLWKHSVLVYFLDHRFLRGRLMRAAPRQLPASAVLELGRGIERRNLAGFLRLARERRMRLVLLGERRVLEMLKEGAGLSADAPGLSWVEADLPASGYLGGDVHWSASGHAEIARRIGDALARRSVFR